MKFPDRFIISRFRLGINREEIGRLCWHGFSHSYSSPSFRDKQC